MNKYICRRISEIKTKRDGMLPSPFVFMEIVGMSYFFFSSCCECVHPRHAAQFPPQSQPLLPFFLRRICHTTTPTTNAQASTIIRISYHCMGYSSFLSSVTAASASSSPLSAATAAAALFLPTGCFLFQNTIPTTAAAITAAKINTVHHQLPTR